MIPRPLDEADRAARAGPEHLAPLAVLFLQVRVVFTERRAIPPVAVVLGVESRVGVIALDRGTGSLRRARLRRVARTGLAAPRGRAVAVVGPADLKLAAAAVVTPAVRGRRRRFAVVQVVVQEAAEVVERTGVVRLGRLPRHARQVRVTRGSLALANLGKDELRRRARPSWRGRTGDHRGGVMRDRGRSLHREARIRLLVLVRSVPLRFPPSFCLTTEPVCGRSEFGVVGRTEIG